MKQAAVVGNCLINPRSVNPALADDSANLNEEREEEHEERHVESEGLSNERIPNRHDVPKQKGAPFHDCDTLLHSVLEGKLPRNLKWKAVLELIGKIGSVVPSGGPDFIFQVGTARAFFKKPHGNDLGMAETSRLRSFLHGAPAVLGARKLDGHERTIVVIDHHSARIFQSPVASQPDHERNIKPYD